MNLYEINAQIYNCVDNETGEVLDIELLEQLSLTRETKLENTSLWVKNMRAESKALADEIKTLQARKKTLDNRCKSIKDYLLCNLNGESFKTSKVAITFRKSSSVEVENVYSLNENFIKHTEPEPDKTAIKNAIKSGEQVTGATLVENISITIK